MKDTFSYWMRTNLKDAYSGLITQDIDFVFISKQKDHFFFIEEKNSPRARVGVAQQIIFKLFNDYLLNNPPLFLGTHILHISYPDKNLLKERINKIKSGQVEKPSYEIGEDTLRRLWDCKGNPQIKKTEAERSQYRGSIIKENLHIFKRDFLFIENIHWIFVNYCTGYFIFIEELTNNEEIKEERKKFIDTIDEIFRANQKSIAKNPKSGAIYQYLGYYRLKFSRTNPDNSLEIYLNSKKISKEELIDVLNLDDNKILRYIIKIKPLI
ncbi:MAG: hypothetical protein RXO36_04270 [Candidatus Nanopusillus acidilobi]|jgi:hypothetical protein